jgi:hypothetical protein
VVAEARFCERCGTPRVHGNRFCEGCGAAFAAAGQAVPRQANEATAGTRLWPDPSPTPPPVVPAPVGSPAARPGGRLPYAAAAPPAVARGLSYRRRLRRTLDSIVRSGRLSARRILMAIGGLMVPVGVYLPWLTIENVSWNGTDVDFHWGGQWTSIAALLGCAVIGIAVARVVAAGAPAQLENLAALAGLTVAGICIARLTNMGEFIAQGVDLNYGWSTTLWGGLIAFVTGIYPWLRRRLRPGEGSAP